MFAVSLRRVHSLEVNEGFPPPIEVILPYMSVPLHHTVDANDIKTNTPLKPSNLEILIV